MKASHEGKWQMQMAEANKGGELPEHRRSILVTPESLKVISFQVIEAHMPWT